MRLTCSSSKSDKMYYVIRSIKRDVKRSSEIVERLGTEAEAAEKYHCSNPLAWMQEHVQERTAAAKEAGSKNILIPLETPARLPLSVRNAFNIGYIFSCSRYIISLGCLPCAAGSRSVMPIRMTWMRCFPAWSTRGSFSLRQGIPAFNRQIGSMSSRTLSSSISTGPCLSWPGNRNSYRRSSIIIPGISSSAVPGYFILASAAS